MRIDHARHPIHPVRPRRPHHRAVVRVAHRKRLRQRKLKRNILPPVVPHAVRTIHPIRLAMRRQPLIHLAAIPRRDAVPPTHGSSKESSARCSPAYPDGTAADTHWGFSIRLIKDRLPIGLLQRIRIAEPAHSSQRSKVMVERTVLLHQQNDMLDVPQRTILGGPCASNRCTLGGIRLDAAAAAAIAPSTR